MNRQNGIALTRAHGLGALPTMLEKRLGTHALMAVFEQEDVPIVAIEDRQTLLPMSAGLHALRGCVVVDMQTAKEFAQPSLGDLLVDAPTPPPDQPLLADVPL